jgi:hypothetical protein
LPQRGGRHLGDLPRSLARQEEHRSGNRHYRHEWVGIEGRALCVGESAVALLGVYHPCGDAGRHEPFRRFGISADVVEICSTGLNRVAGLVALDVAEQYLLVLIGNVLGLGNVG